MARGWGCYEPLPLEFETNKIILKLEIVKDDLGIKQCSVYLDLTETELSNARSDLVELTEAGFKVKTMLDEVSLDRNKENIADHGSQVEQHIKEKVEAARDWLEGAIHSWKGHLGFVHLRSEKID
ncbi:hypothetical protein HID58_057740 [Brassica napus]|uniref:Uncharacterized protein n=1 Tax=Brassica napus TaxID=3708 RepID=A0ABQ7XGS4_BRANA|nr:hypothetical protein HID58_057740 [Brassica napus]